MCARRHAAVRSTASVEWRKKLSTDDFHFAARRPRNGSLFFFIFPTLSHFFPPTWSANTNALIRMRVTYCSVRSYHLGEEKRCEHHSRRRRFRFECWGCTSALPFSSIIIVPDKQESTGSVRGATGPGVGGGERLFLSWPSARTKATARKSWERFFPTEIAAAAALARAFFLFFFF